MSDSRPGTHFYLGVLGEWPLLWSEDWLRRRAAAQGIAGRRRRWSRR